MRKRTNAFTAIMKRATLTPIIDDIKTLLASSLKIFNDTFVDSTDKLFI